MASLGLVVALCLVSCTYTAPEISRPHLHELVATASLDSSQDIKTAVDNRAEDEETGNQGEDIGTEKTSIDIAAGKTGGLDRGLVSDVIESTLSGVHLGFAIGSNNGTLDRLCIKLGNITMAGCRRTASQERKKIPDTHTTELKTARNAMYHLTITLPTD